MIRFDADDDRTVIIGGPTGDVEGSTPACCQECGTTVWLSPVMVQKKESLPPSEVIVACMLCVEMRPSVADDVIITPEQIEELSRSLGWRVTEEEMRDILRRHLIERDN